jgi:hypothetical protein
LVFFIVFSYECVKSQNNATVSVVERVIVVWIVGGIMVVVAATEVKGEDESGKEDEKSEGYGYGVAKAKIGEVTVWRGHGD